MGISKKQHQMKVLSWQFQTLLFTNPASDRKGWSHIPGNPALQKYWPVQKWHLSQEWKLQVMCRRRGIVKVCVCYFQSFHELKKETNPALEQGRFSIPWERFYKTFTQNCFAFVREHWCLTQRPSLSSCWGSAAFLWEVRKVPPSTVSS